MAKFIKAYNKLLGFEGGYSMDPDDKGKETYKGISRVYHPNWEGWKLIDYYKTCYPGIFETKFNSNLTLQKLVESFYKKEYWDYFQCDDIKSQDIAEELFESSVNIGKKRVTMFLQQSLNLLNKNQALFNDIKEDGVFGKNTKYTIDVCISNKKDEKYLFNLLNIFQGYKYIQSAQEKFIRGWLGRIKIKKK